VTNNGRGYTIRFDSKMRGWRSEKVNFIISSNVTGSFQSFSPLIEIFGVASFEVPNLCPRINVYFPSSLIRSNGS